MMRSDANTASDRNRKRDTERKVPMSFQFQPAALADATPVSFPAPAAMNKEKSDKPMMGGWWLVPYIASGTMFWLWFIPTVTKTII